MKLDLFTSYFFIFIVMIIIFIYFKNYKHDIISVFYVVAMALLCAHLAHGFSSVFQSIGIRSESWRAKLDLIGVGYAWLIFIGFSIVPLSVLAQKHEFMNFMIHLFSHRK